MDARAREVIELRRLIGSLDNGAWGAEPGGDADSIKCVRAADFNFDRLRVNIETAPMRKIDEPIRTRLQLMRGDLVLEKSGGGTKTPAGRAVMFDSDEPAVCSNFAARVRPAVWVDSHYLSYLLASLYYRGTTARCVLQTTGIQNLDTNAWLQSAVPHLQVDEQRRIVDFLDDQVARIDNIIAARTRQVLGSEELGEAMLDTIFNGPPRPLRTLLTQAPSYGVLVPRFADDGVPFIRINDLSTLHDGHPLVQIERTQSVEYRRTLVRQGDVLVSVVGSLDKHAVVRQGREGANIARAVARLVPMRGFPSEVLNGWLSSSSYNHQARLATGAGTAQPTLNMSDLSAFRIALPEAPIGRVAQEVHEALSTAEVARCIFTSSQQLLQGLKRSLITAAVTGKFDVSSADGSRVRAAV